MTCPFELSKGPPELPGFIAASIANFFYLSSNIASFPCASGCKSTIIWASCLYAFLFIA